MWTRKIKSALLVDLDNVGGKRLGATIDNWVAWIEDGAFSKTARPRKLLDKRVYWNGVNDMPRAPFEQRGFKAFACRSESTVKVRANKSSADIVMTIDAMEIAHTLKGLQEIVLLTADTDFVPLVGKLQEMKLKVVVVGKVTDPSSTIFRKWAEEVISDEDLFAAGKYERAARKHAKPPAPAPPAMSEPAAKPRAAPPARAKQRKKFDLAAAAKALVEVAMQTPNRPVSRAVIERALSTVPHFIKVPTKRDAAYLGFNNLETLLRQIASIEPRLRYAREPDGGQRLRFVGVLPDEPPQPG